MGVNREVLLAEMRKSGYYLRPDVQQAHGYYWPHGAPSELPPAGDLLLVTYWDEDDVDFVLAYTADQRGANSFFTPLRISRPFAARVAID